MATAGRPGPVVLAMPEDMLRDEVEALDRPAVPPLAEAPDPGAIQALFELLKEADQRRSRSSAAPTGARAPAHHFATFAFRHGIPVAAAFRRQDAIDNSCRVYAGQLGYGPNPKLQQRIRDADLMLAVGARLGEVDHRRLQADHARPSRPDAGPRPPRPQRARPGLSRRPADLRRHGRVRRDGRPTGAIPTWSAFHAGEEAHREWLEWSRAAARARASQLDLGPCVKAMRDALPANTIICNGAGNFSGWWHRYWRYGAMPTQLAPTSGTMGYGLPAAVAAALRFKDRPVVCVAGDGDFLMNGQELATAAQYGADLLVIVVDNGAYGTIRMHQERDYPKRVSARPTSPTPISPSWPRPMAAGRSGSRRPRTSRPRSPSDEAQGHPPAPLHDRRRADHQPDDDCGASRRAETSVGSPISGTKRTPPRSVVATLGALGTLTSDWLHPGRRSA